MRHLNVDAIVEFIMLLSAYRNNNMDINPGKTMLDIR